MKNLDPNMTHAEIKLSMIEDILQMDFNKAGKKNFNETFHFFLDLNDEIDRVTAVTEVNNLIFFSALGMPESFLIEDIETTFKENVFWSDYIHIYFIKDEEEITLLLRFNIAADNNDEMNIKFETNERLYILKNQKLSRISDTKAKRYIEDFKELYDSRNFNPDQSMYTQYITFDYTKVRKNFKEFPAITQLLTAAKNDPLNGLLRLNTILQIDRTYCKDPKTPDNDVFYNIGNMQP
ncbi:hypothetical protein [Chryseobacterium sp. MMS23-Vi53]|uniref:hypothetical protein n=1 Tax=Chryseobacterium sp. MMS23-Vi53 TaxID=3386644 RepID=UPI0039E9E089